MAKPNQSLQRSAVQLVFHSANRVVVLLLPRSLNSSVGLLLLMVAKMIIRNFEPKDAEAVSFVIRQTMRVSNSIDYSLDRLEPLIKYFSPEKVLLLNEERHCLVAETDDQVVGTVAIEGTELVTFFVLPAYQKMGIGAQLLRAIERIAIENKINRLNLEASITGTPFYEKFGYRRTGFVKGGTAGKQIGLEKALY